MNLAAAPIRSTAFFIVLSLAGLGIPATMAADAYRLDVSDRLSIKVVQWKAGETAFEEWTALGGDYVVGADGTLNFPMVGAAQGAGMTSAELASDLGARLQQALGLASAPVVSVEVAAYGPIYVSGDVSSPGEYPFAPNLTVVKALALAGGERRSAEASARPEREMLTTSGALDVLEEEHRRLLVRLARLDAELAGIEEIPIPPQLADYPGLEGLVSAELAILQAQKRRVEAQSLSLSDQAGLLANQLEAFEQKQANTERQLVSAREQLERITALSDDGLAVQSRVASMQTNVADLEARLLDTQTAMLQARQDIAATDREQAQLTDQRLADITLERQTVDGQIGALALKIATQRGLVQEAALNGGASVLAGEAPAYGYAIMRGDKEIPAQLNTPVQPGDVIIARLHLSQDRNAP